MGSDDPEIVRGAFEAMAAGLEADEDERARLAQRWWDPEIEYTEDPSWPGASSYRGRKNVLGAFEGYREVLGGAVSVEEVLQGTDGVLAQVTYTGRTAGAELPWEQPFAYHCRVRDGRLSYLRAYFDVGEARRDSGVSSP
jgi:ketosteroid isomerase-like protein